MSDWVAQLSSVSYEFFWFCWSNGMVPNMGLMSKTGKPTVAYYRYKKAISLGLS